MLLELATCAFAVFGTSSCDVGNAAAGKEFQELVLAYEKVLETKGDRKLRGLKDIHQQLDEIATRYPDADVTAKILSSDIVGINLSRVERAIQKLDPVFNKQTETIVGSDISSSYDVIEAPYNDLIVQIASVPHVRKNLPIEVKAAPPKEVLAVSTKQQPPIPLPTAKPKRETPVVVADIPLPTAKPEVKPKQQSHKQLVSSLPKIADWNMLVMPTVFTGGSQFKPSSTWNNLGSQSSHAAIAASPVILAQAETDVLDDKEVTAKARKAEANDASWYVAMGYSTPIWSENEWGYDNSPSNPVVAHESPRFEKLNGFNIEIGKEKSHWSLGLGLEEIRNASWRTASTTLQSGSIYGDGYIDFKQQNLFVTGRLFTDFYLKNRVFVSTALGISKVDVGEGTLVRNGVTYPQGTAYQETLPFYRLGFGLERAISENVSVVGDIAFSDFGKIHNKSRLSGVKNYFIRRQDISSGISLKYSFD